MSHSLPATTGVYFVDQKDNRNDLYPAISAQKTPSLKQPGKVVLVTGASRGIGRAIALQYAHADVATLVLVSRSKESLEKVAKEIGAINANVQVLVRPLNVTSETDVAALAQDLKHATNGRLDVLINNAGTSDSWKPLVDTNPSQWWNTIEVNVRGPYLFLHAFLPLLQDTAAKQGKQTHVVNMSSIGANMRTPGASAYCSSKLTLDLLTEYVTIEHGEKGVTAVSVHPGGVETELSSSEPTLKGRLHDTPDLCGGWAVWMTAEDRAWLGGRYVSAQWDVNALLAKQDEIVKGDKLRKRLVI